MPDFKQEYKAIAKSRPGIFKITDNRLEQKTGVHKYLMGLHHIFYAVENVKKFFEYTGWESAEVFYTDTFDQANVLAKDIADKENELGKKNS